MGYFFHIPCKHGGACAGLPVSAAPALTHLAILHFSKCLLPGIGCMTNLILRNVAIPILLEGDATDCCTSTFASQDIAK